MADLDPDAGSGFFSEAGNELTNAQKAELDEFLECASENKAESDNLLGEINESCYENNDTRAACKEKAEAALEFYTLYEGCILRALMILEHSSNIGFPFAADKAAIAALIASLEAVDDSSEGGDGGDDGGDGGEEGGEDEVTACGCKPCNLKPELIFITHTFEIKEREPALPKFENLGVYAASVAKTKKEPTMGYNKIDPKSKELSGFNDS